MHYPLDVQQYSNEYCVMLSEEASLYVGHNPQIGGGGSPSQGLNTVTDLTQKV